MTDWHDVTPSTPSWGVVSPDTVHYKRARRGQLYAGHKGGLLSGALTVHVLVDGTPSSVAFYAGYMGAVAGITYGETSPTTTSWSDVSLDATTWHDV